MQICRPCLGFFWGAARGLHLLLGTGAGGPRWVLGVPQHTGPAEWRSAVPQRRPSSLLSGQGCRVGVAGSCPSCGAAAGELPSLVIN